MGHLMEVAAFANPNYGHGLLRRRVLLRSSGQRVVAELEDDMHAMRVTVEHDGHAITGIQPEVLRANKSTCTEAEEELMPLVGAELSDSPLAMAGNTEPKRQCTHLLDLLSLAVTHARRGEQRRQYDALVWDERGGQTKFEVQCNNKALLDGVFKGDFFLSPDPFTGHNVRQGFIKWASKVLPQEQLEAAMILQRTHLTAQGRRILWDKIAGRRVIEFADTILGACYSFSPGVVERGINLPDTERDYSETPDKLLAFSRPLD